MKKQKYSIHGPRVRAFKKMLAQGGIVKDGTVGVLGHYNETNDREAVAPLSKLRGAIKGTLDKRRSRGGDLFIKVTADTKKLAAAIWLGKKEFLNALARAAHANAKAHGFWDSDRADAECLALMHAELSEALEALRDPLTPKYPYAYILRFDKGPTPKPYGIAEELADTIIRIFDFCGARRIDIGRAVIDKMAYNQTRPHKHEKKF
jgi:NTP pyrophosphatase (non-canonical NTP hydrolase)